jgi:hypothetical protein
MLDRTAPRTDPRAAVRPEYQALVDGYPSLLRDFGIELSGIDLADLGVLMAAIEHVDRVLDALPRAIDRDAFARTVVAMLRREPRTLELHIAQGVVALAADAALVHDAHDGALAHAAALAGDAALAHDAAFALGRSVRALRVMALRRGVSQALVALTAETLSNTEQMRCARDRATYVACIEREGALCTELALLVVPLPARPSGFLRAIAAPANLMDKLLDLRRDHQRGEAAVDPGIGTHAVLATRMVRSAWVASRLHPNRLGFIAWGVRWLLRMAR